MKVNEKTEKGWKAGTIPGGARRAAEVVRRVEIPFMGSAVMAGFPSPAEQYVERPLDLNELLVARPAATYFVRAQGDSMEGVGIRSGDMLVVDRSLEPWDRSVIVACVDGEFTEKDYAMLARYVLSAMDGCGNYPQCSGFDRVATVHLRGWVDSLQRRRMAERFLDWQPFRHSHPDKETGIEEYEEPTPEEVANLFRTRAAAELAADEKDLTDLREVYGAWEEDGEDAEPPDGEKK